MAEQEIIHADTDKALTDDELISALDKISHPSEVEDMSLSVDPDDYPLTCACVHSNRYDCIAIRTNRSYEEVTDCGDECQCYCHAGEEGEEYIES